MLALVALSSGWAAHAGTLPSRFPLLGGPVGVGVVWAVLSAGLGLAYGATALASGVSVRGMLRRVGICVLLALLSTHLCRRLVETLITPWSWHQLYYLKRLVPVGLVLIWCATLLRRETLTLVRAARSSAVTAPVPQLAVVLASAAILVSWGDLVLEWSGSSAAGATLKSEIIYREAWTANVLVLAAAYALALAVTVRLGAALLLVTPLYVGLGLATLLKIRYMHSAVQPLDLLRIPELLPFLRGFLGIGALAAVAGAGALWVSALVVLHRVERCPMSAVRRWFTGLVSLAVLLPFPVAYFQASFLPDDVEYPQPWADAFLGRFKIGGREFKEMARLRGFLISFISELPGTFASKPSGYSPELVASTVGKYCRPGMPPGQPPRVNLIIYLIESFMDPNDLGLHYTADPIPNIRALRQAHIGGYGIVPEEFGGSANTEFEALTGMSTAFLPKGSVAYRLYLRQPIPSLPRALGRLGYTTTAVQADPKHFFNRERAYRLLGFDRVAWLGEEPGVQLSPRGWWPSDSEVAKAVIQASRGPLPFFVFAFPSSTHFPYNRGTYSDSDLDVLDVPSENAAGEVKEYINTLRVADQTIGSLVEYFRHRPDSTIIAVLGDHLPPLPQGALRTFFTRLSRMPQPEQARRRRRVPLLVWANFPLVREQTELSIHALPSYLLEKMRIEPSGFLSIPDAVRRRLPVLMTTAAGAEVGTWDRDSLGIDQRSLVEDYRLLQYDLLIGKQYSLRSSAATTSSCSGAIDSRRVSSP